MDRQEIDDPDEKISIILDMVYKCPISPYRTYSASGNAGLKRRKCYERI